MNNRIKSLALMVNLGIYGVAFPLSAAEETTDSKQAAGEETMVVTAEVQTYRRRAFPPLPPMKFANVRRRATSLKSSVPCRAST